MSHIVFISGEEIVKADHIVTVGQESLAQVGAQETGTSCNQRSAMFVVVSHEEFRLFLNCSDRLTSVIVTENVSTVDFLRDILDIGIQAVCNDHIRLLFKNRQIVDHS